MSRTAYHHHRQPEYHRVGGASTILPSDQPPPRPLSLSILPSRSLATGPSLSLLHGTLPLTLLAEDQAGRQGAIGLRSVWVANQAAKVRIPSTRRFHVAVEKRHEDATWDESVRIFPPRGKWNASGRMLLVPQLSHHQLPTRTFPRYQTFATWPTKDSFPPLILLNNASPIIRDLSKMWFPIWSLRHLFSHYFDFTIAIFLLKENPLIYEINTNIAIKIFWIYNLIYKFVLILIFFYSSYCVFRQLIFFSSMIYEMVRKYAANCSGVIHEISYPFNLSTHTHDSPIYVRRWKYRNRRTATSIARRSHAWSSYCCQRELLISGFLASRGRSPGTCSSY